MISTPVFIPDSVFTSEHFSQVLNEIEHRIALLNNHKNSLPKWTSSTEQICKHSNIDGTSIKDLTALCSLILQEKHNRAPLTITTAAPVSDDEQNKIYSWLCANISHHIMIRFHVDRTLMAGVIIQTPQARWDYSLHNGLHDGRQYLATEVLK